LLGVDIIRESQTGQLYVLETNPYGMTWHFSSPLSKTFDPQHAASSMLNSMRWTMSPTF
jgi:hypothetical protein